MALTKTRFVVATDCATKLYYKDNKAQYVDKSADDEYLKSLAEGGFQVGALAQVLYEGGQLIDAGTLQDRIERTRQLLMRDEVTLYEAAIAHGPLLALVDVLVKKGDRVQLLEVKAKSYDPAKDADLRKQRGGGFKAEFLDYLYDVAFQHHVFAHAYPALRAQPYLVLADKTRAASVDGLNQRFKIRRISDTRSTVDVAPGTTRASLGEPLLHELDVSEQVAEIRAGTLTVGDQTLPWPQAIERLARAHLDNERIWTPPAARCGGCEFRAEPDGERRSGFRECWGHAFGWTDADFAQPSVLDLYNHRGKDKFIASRLLKLAQLRETDLGEDDEHRNGGLSLQGRQKLQVRHARTGAPEVHFDAEGYRRERSRWAWPLNFIDFETCTVAIPFTRGRRPYEQTAFQFSHHVMHADGRVEHATQFIDTRPGHFPNYDFVRALRAALLPNSGTVFRWHNHEQTILRKIREQLAADRAQVADADALIEFIDSITFTVDAAGNETPAPRTMVDLCDIAARYYFHPSTKGSSSLKKVLPALMYSSAFLRDRYGQPVYGKGAEIPSLNVDPPVAWWQQQDNGAVRDPYDLLPPLFPGMSREEQERLEWALPENLQDGGAAMTAYARLQFEAVPDDMRAAVERALLRYCELDTLAMVMAVQAWDAASQAAA